MIYSKVGLIYHPVGTAAREFAAHLRTSCLGEVPDVWSVHTGDDVAFVEHVAGTELLICIGGDGTVLWAAKAAIPHAIPIISVNMGRLGFLSELERQDAEEGTRRVLRGEGAVEERAMIECVLAERERGVEPLVALNDIVIGRAAAGRPVYLSVAVDGVHLATVRADALILATATGSTAYNLSAGGPVLMPQSRAILLTPVAPHLSRMRPIVLPEDSSVEIEVETDHSAIVSIDGRVDLPLQSGNRVTVRRSPHTAQFMRLHSHGAFFERLAHHLNLSTRQQ
ncbi:MAG TPA: NAD(+)/NADH kinase [Dehalococcoidia bacterium]|nr:NAD(+)/NADH kinase [Dehalococcoidia bacterium]